MMVVIKCGSEVQTAGWERSQCDSMTYLDRTAGGVTKTTHQKVNIGLAHTTVGLRLRTGSIIVGHFDCG